MSVHVKQSLWQLSMWTAVSYFHYLVSLPYFLNLIAIGVKVSTPNPEIPTLGEKIPGSLTTTAESGL